MCWTATFPRTSKSKSASFSAISRVFGLLVKVARPVRVELTTYSFGGCRSIHLSYGRTVAFHGLHAQRAYAKTVVCILILTLARLPRQSAFGRPQASLSNGCRMQKLRRSALCARFDVVRKFFNFLGFFEHPQREHLGGVRLLHLRFQVSRELVQLLDVLFDVLLIGLEHHFGRRLPQGGRGIVRIRARVRSRRPTRRFGLDGLSLSADYRQRASAGQNGQKLAPRVRHRYLTARCALKTELSSAAHPRWSNVILSFPKKR